MKECARKDCQMQNPQADSAFSKSPKNKSGLSSYCRHCTSRLQKQYKNNDPEKAALNNRKGFLKYFYGITLEQYQEMLARQNSQCAICKVHALAFDRSLHVDHCHKTGKIRGLLCSNCNHVLGKARDEVKILKAAIKYLEKSKWT